MFSTWGKFADNKWAGLGHLLSMYGLDAGGEEKDEESTSPTTSLGLAHAQQMQEQNTPWLWSRAFPAFSCLVATSSLCLKTFSVLPYSTTQHCSLQLFCNSSLGPFPPCFSIPWKTDVFLLMSQLTLTAAEWIQSFTYSPLLLEAFLCHALLLHAFPAWYLWQHKYLSICCRSPLSSLAACYLSQMPFPGVSW